MTQPIRFAPSATRAARTRSPKPTTLTRAAVWEGMEGTGGVVGWCSGAHCDEGNACSRPEPTAHKARQSPGAVWPLPRVVTPRNATQSSSCSRRCPQTLQAFLLFRVRCYTTHLQPEGEVLEPGGGAHRWAGRRERLQREKQQCCLVQKVQTICTLCANRCVCATQLRSCFQLGESVRRRA